MYFGVSACKGKHIREAIMVHYGSIYWVKKSHQNPRLKSFSRCIMIVYILPETNKSHLKMEYLEDEEILLGRPIFRGYKLVLGRVFYPFNPSTLQQRRIDSERWLLHLQVVHDQGYKMRWANDLGVSKNRGIYPKMDDL